ncbi:unnamed protein product [Lactuca saligna]|uniref:Uncharacterized protein n=1 Tax=Lactuca saligna TaxID=75948 RepID=A0AA35VC44_LACSI|nr:unnamed protein product [Lactuca saligna]
MVFGDDDDIDEALGGFTYSPFKIRSENEDEPSATKEQLKSLHEKIGQLLLVSKSSSSDSYSKEAVESLFECVTKEHAANVEKMSKAIGDSTEVCKMMTKKVDKLILRPLRSWRTFRQPSTTIQRMPISLCRIWFLSSKKRRLSYKRFAQVSGLITKHFKLPSLLRFRTFKKNW